MNVQKNFFYFCSKRRLFYIFGSHETKNQFVHVIVNKEKVGISKKYLKGIHNLISFHLSPLHFNILEIRYLPTLQLKLSFQSIEFFGKFEEIVIVIDCWRRQS